MVQITGKDLPSVKRDFLPQLFRVIISCCGMNLLSTTVISEIDQIENFESASFASQL